MNLPISSQGCIVQEFTAEWKALLIYYEQVLRPRLRGATVSRPYGSQVG